ncbi:MAG: hypothetical protein P1U53_10520 [Sulfitobacter sp.]|nr:hypothetical protein [Sulfitobacter sp.]
MLARTFRAIAASATLLCLATAASATEHEVLIVDGAYFPPLVYAELGDTVTFINDSSDNHEVQASDESWTSGIIPMDGSFALAIEVDTVLTFQATAETEGTGDGDGDVMLEQIGEVIIGDGPGASLTDG